MKNFLLCLILALWAANAFSQSNVTGAVKDAKDGSPVAFATAALLRTDSSAITGVMTDDDGRFVIENVAAGNYLLQVSFIGYEKVYRPVNVPAQSDVGEIMLTEDANVLSEVVVTGRRALIDQRLDRIVVNVTGNMITAGRNINDLLKQMPGLVVDESGNVKLNGRPATVYIDGRPTNLPAEQVAQMLTGMMGDMIDRVELIDNPSSRYEAGMSSAIVNIRLKRDASLGVNGSAQVGVGVTKHDFTSRGGINLNFRSKKVNIFGNYGYDNVPFYSDLYQLRNYSGTTPLTYDQYTLIRLKIPGHTVRAGLDWFINSKHTIGLLFNGGYNNQKGEMVSDADIMLTGSTKIDSTILANTRPVSRFNSQMYNLNYRFDGDKNGVLTADLDIGHVYNKTGQHMQSRYLDESGKELREPTEFQYSGPRNLDITAFKLDYSKQMSEASNLEAGLKTGQTVTDNEIVYENLNEGLWELDPTQSNRFKYTEQVSAAYLTYSHRFGKLSAMAGVRVEYTSTKGESPTIDTTFTHNYLDWFPSAYLQYQINEKQSLNISYSRKINRPGYSLLNPFRLYADPFTYQSGNPDLEPSYINTAALRYNIGSYSANLSYTVENDIFQQDYVQDDTNRTMGLVTNNIGKREQLTLSISIPVQIAKWYNISLYSETSYNKADTRHSGEQFLNNFWSAYGGLYHNFTIMPTMRANINMWWMKPPWSGILHQEDLWSMSAQIEKTLLDERLSLSLSANDIFNSVIAKGTMKFGNIDQYMKQELNQQHIMLTIRYSFGSSQIRGARNRSVGIEEEMGRAR
ncbi:MAG: TonB-dependent receptor family protein [Tannerella sp.]|nr:TonB-dependent receptor family protein [Tannerella sp.]